MKEPLESVQTDTYTSFDELLGEFERHNPGLLQQLSALALQSQIRLSVYPPTTAGGSSSSTSENTTQ